MSISVYPPPEALARQLFVSSGVWAKPPGALLVRSIIWAARGGYEERWFLASELPDTVSVEVSNAAGGYSQFHTFRASNTGGTGLVVVESYSEMPLQAGPAVQAALVRSSDGLVVNITSIRFTFESAWLPPEGHMLVLAMRQDGSYRYVGPGFRYDAASDKFLHPRLSGPTAIAAGQTAAIVAQWHNEDGNPVAYQAPITLEVLGQRAAYVPDAQGRAEIPFTSHVPGEYVIQVVEPELGVILATHPVAVS